MITLTKEEEQELAAIDAANAKEAAQVRASDALAVYGD